MHHSVRCLVFGLVALAGTGHGLASDHANSTCVASDSGATTATSSVALSSTTSAASAIPTLSNATCESRTANYITHKLPQQCLRTDRVGANATRSTEATQSSRAGDGRTATNQTTTPETLAPSSGPGVATSTALASTWIWTATESSGVASPSTTPVEISVITSPGNSEIIIESESPLDNANFLSFEEWKRQNEVKAGQSGEQANAQFGGDRQRPGINNALDSLGEEGEIEIDFSGFGSGADGPRQQQAAYRTAEGASSAASTAPESYTPRSKDAGKTCKERTNYASFDCAATVLKNNPECKSASSVLVENKDSYMLNTCSATNKFFIVELCNDILIDTVVLANYEFFSSIFRHFRVSVSDRYPVKMDKWRDLGTFEARNTREVQAFLIQHPQIWARYLRIEFLTHYGSEYYCPVSLLRVHGTTMLEEIRPQEDSLPGDGADEAETLQAEAIATPLVSQEPLASTDENAKKTAHSLTSVTAEAPKISSTPTTERDPERSSSPSQEGGTSTSSDELPTSSVNSNGGNASISLIGNAGSTCATNSTSLRSDDLQTSADSRATGQDRPVRNTESSSASTSIRTSAVVQSRMSANSSAAQTTLSESLIPKSENGTGYANTTSTAIATNTTATHKVDTGKQGDPDVVVTASSTNLTRPTTATPSNAAPPQPSTQESFFKSIHKRLQQLEANSTLSLQYIEEQSRILRDAFQKVEKRQISATTSFLAHLNETVMTELRGFRQAYDQLWQSTVIELEGQREQYQREMVAISTRLTLVADELVWQKRMSIVQSTLILLCLGLVLFARNGQNPVGAFEVPLMQHMMNSKSQTSLSKTRTQDWESPPASPSPEGRSPVSLFRRKLMWRSITDPLAGFESGTDSRPGTRDGSSAPRQQAVDVTVEPPTPERPGVLRSPSSQSAVSKDGEDGEDANEVYDGPPTPRVNGEGGQRPSTPLNLESVGVDVT